MKIKDKKEPEEPRLNYIDRNSFWRINVAELIADAGLIAFSIFFSKYLFNESDIVFHRLEPWKIMGLYVIVVLTMPWYMGYLYAIYGRFYSKPVMKIVLWSFVFILFVILVYIIRILFSLDWMSNTKSDGSITDFMGTFALFMLVLGPIMSIGGFNAGHDDLSPPGKKLSDEVSATGALMVVVLNIAILIWWCNIPYVNQHGWLFILAFIGSSFAAVIVFGIVLGIKMLLKKMGIYGLLAGFGQTAFPFFIITALILWSDIGQHYIML